MKPYLLSLLALALFPACITINENGYRNLSRKEKQQVLPFDKNATGNKDSSGGFCLREIVADDVREVMKDHEYTWLHLWIPYCKAPSCRPPVYYEKVSKNAGGREVQYLLISRIYDYRTVSGMVDRFSYKGPVYVVKHARYGRNMPGASERFAAELTKDRSASFGAHLLFRKERLIYAGNDLSQATMDSVLALDR